MYDRILFPTDGEAGARAVQEYAVEVAAAHDATLHLLYVADTTHDSVTRIGGEVVDALEREGRDVVSAAADRAGTRVETVTDVLQGGVPETVADYAGEYGIDLVVMPTQGRSGVERLLLGSTTERVVRRSPVPVLTVRPDDEWTYPYGDVLVATDGSDCADAALDAGVETAAAHDATLHLVSVVDLGGIESVVRSDDHVAALEEAAETTVDEAAATAEAAGVETVTAVERGTPVREELRSYAETQDVDLVVAGTHGHTGVDRYFVGSVAENLVRTSPVPVLTVRAPEAG